MTIRRLIGPVIAVLGALILLTACEKHEHEEQTAGSRLVSVPLAFCLQTADDGETAEAEARAAVTRAMGDPGTYERFNLPEYAYIYFVVEFEDGTTQLCPTTNSEGTTKSNPINLRDDAWTKTQKSTSTPRTQDDSVYQYADNFYFRIPTKNSSNSTTKDGRVYVAMSRYELPNVRVLNPGESTIEANVLALTFDASDDNVRRHLQDIYSTPYNYMVDGQYYCTFNDILTTSLLQQDLLLYHVAAKVDIMWNVAEERRSDLQISYVEARRLKQQNCKLFRPTENTWTSDDEANNYSLELMDQDISSQWLGRRYFYTIPFTKTEDDKEYFDINLHLLKLPDTKATLPAPAGYNLTIRKNMASESHVFAPWLRPDLKFTTTMEYDNITKTTE